jgi:hypothetical protein
MRIRLVMLAVVLLIGGGIFSANPTPAHASCAEMPPPETALRDSAAVFSGIVLSKRELNDRSGVRSSDDPVEVTFRVTEAWKGVDSDRMTVRTAESVANRFVEGMPYMVYARKTLTGLRIDSCTRTADLALASEDLAALGKGTVPPPSPELEARIRSNPVGLRLFWAGTAFAVLAAAVLVTLLLRLMRRQ